MKKFILPLLVLSLFACNSEQSSDTSNEADDTIIADFLADVASFETIDEKAPIAYFAEIADKAAEEVVELTNDNIEDVINAAKHYNHCVIIVEDHTIIKLTDVEDCKQSGSWGACMPMAEGYIKKGDLEYQEDYINNIIGMPDSQERTAFFFK